MKITAIDVGGTFIKYALMTDQSEFLERGKIPTPMTNRDDFLDAITNIHRAFDGSEGIAISMPGIIDTKQGVCITSGALEYNIGFRVVDELQSRCSVRVAVENDANCAALAEASVGSLADVSNGFVMIFGTAIGGALIKDHKIYRGSHYSAGEISFVVPDLDGMPEEENLLGYRCGVPQLCEDFARRKELEVESVDGVMIFNAVEQNDPIALECLDRFTRRIALQIFNVQNLFDPDRIAIGGGISAQQSFLDAINRNLETIYEKCPIELNRAEVVACRYRNDANLIGALQNYLGD